MAEDPVPVDAVGPAAAEAGAVASVASVQSPQAAAPAEDAPPAAADDATQAEQARAGAAERLGGAARRGRPVPAPAPGSEPSQIPLAEGEDINPYARFGKSPDDGVDLMERARLNAMNSFYRNTLAGAGRMVALSHLVANPDPPDTPPEVRAAHDRQREDYQRVIADLARYDLIAPWSGGAEATYALGGSLAGSLMTPESFVGIPAKGVTMLARTVRAGLQQAGIMATVDPIVQMMSISAGTERHFDPWRWIASAGMGTIIGGGLHWGGEIVGSMALKRTLGDLSKQDPAFFKPDEQPGFTVERFTDPATGQTWKPGEPVPEGAVSTGRAEPVPAAEGPIPSALPAATERSPEGAPAWEPIEAYHGSPHDFTGFDINRIGTGEGAQSYGHGLYFAEREGVARHYRDDLSAKDSKRSRDAFAEDYQKRFGENWRKPLEGDIARERARGDSGGEFNAENLEDAKKLLEQGYSPIVDGGVLYKVRINADREHFLDWDKSISEQPRALAAYEKLPENLRTSLEATLEEKGVSTDPRGMTGRDLYRALAAASDEHAASLSLHEAGILGIKYLDQGSRVFADGDNAKLRIEQIERALKESPSDGTPVGNARVAKLHDEIEQLKSPTRNFVVFDDKLVEATHKNDVLIRVARRGGDGELRSVAIPADEVRPTDRVQPAEKGARPEGEQPIAVRQSGSRLPEEQTRSALGVTTEEARPAGEVARTTEGGPPATREGGVAGGAEAPEPREVAIRSLQQQAMDLADALGFPLRQGRMAGHGKDTLGIFKSKSGVVRVREVPDFEVVAHEAGHYIEARVGQELTDMIEHFGPTELSKLVSNPAAYEPAQFAKEGFAEYIRRYMGNPAFAQAQAPAFTTAFRDMMNTRAPQVLRAIDEASAAYRAYLEAPSVDAVGAVIRSQDEGNHGWRSYLPKKIRDAGFPVIIKTMMQDAYTAFLDKNAPVARAVREMAEAIHTETGSLVDLKAADNPEILLRLFARSQQAAVRDMMDGVRGYRSTNPEGPSLSQAMAKATGEATVFGKWNPELKESFSTYLIARRAGVLWDRFNRGDLPNPPTAFSRGDAVVALQELERANPQFREASDMVHAWTRQLLKKQFDGGLIDADLYGRLIKEEFYVPFMRDLSDKPLAGGVGPGNATPGVRVADTVKKIQGSSRDIKDPVESLMLQAFLVNRTLRHNDIIHSFVNLAEDAGIHGGRYVEKIPALEAKKYTFDLSDAVERAAREKGMNADDTRVLTSAMADVFGPDPIVGSFFRQEAAGARGEPIVFYKDGGVMKAARFMSGEEGHALYETLTALPTAISDVGLQLLSTGASVLRGTIVTNPVFALTNYIRDQMAVGILRRDYVPFVSGTKGLISEVRQGEAAQLYGYAGSVSAGASVAPLEQAAKAEVDALAKQGYIVNRVSSLHGFLEMASITEAGTRNSVFDTVFRAKKAQGLSEYEAMIEAAWQAHDILDFSRFGSKTLYMRQLTPFVNAHIQGLEKAYRTLIEPLYREAVTASEEGARKNAILGLTKMMAVGSALGAAWAAGHHADEIYQDAKPELKGTHFVTSIGNKIFVIPKPFELSIGFTAGEFGYQKLMKNDPRAALQFAEAAWEVIKPPIPVLDNPLIKTTGELILGKSAFFGNDIVPQPLQRLNVQEQYTDRTSSVAKFIGQSIGVSPIKVDYGIGAYFGLWGRDIAALSSGVDERTPAQNWEDRALVRRFIKDPTRSSDTVTQFWKFMGQTTGQFNQSVATYDFLNKSFRDDDAKAFLSKLTKDERAFVILKSAANEDGKPAFNADQKRLFPLQRAYDAVTILNGMRRELSDDTFKTYESGQNVKLSPRDRRDMIDNLRELAQTEMRNSFVIMKTPGWAERPVMDLAPIMDKIRKVSPMVADEVATRYATGRVYTTRAIAQSYDRLRDEVIRNGSQADVGDMAADARSEGYEFGGERVRKPQKRRVVIPAQVPLPPAVAAPQVAPGAAPVQ